MTAEPKCAYVYDTGDPCNRHERSHIEGRILHAFVPPTDVVLPSYVEDAIDEVNNDWKGEENPVPPFHHPKGKL